MVIEIEQCTKLDRASGNMEKYNFLVINLPKFGKNHYTDVLFVIDMLCFMSLFNHFREIFNNKSHIYIKSGDINEYHCV